MDVDPPEAEGWKDWTPVWVTVVCTDPAPFLEYTMWIDHHASVVQHTRPDKPFEADALMSFEVLTFKTEDCVHNTPMEYGFNVSVRGPIFQPGLVPMDITLTVAESGEDAARPQARAEWSAVSPLRGDLSIRKGPGLYTDEVTLDLKNWLNVPVEGIVSLGEGSPEGISFEPVPFGPLGASFSDNDSVEFFFPVQVDKALREGPHDTYPITLAVQAWMAGEPGRSVWEGSVDFNLYIDTDGAFGESPLGWLPLGVLMVVLWASRRL